jgi:hypothetical protein
LGGGWGLVWGGGGVGLGLGCCWGCGGGWLGWCRHSAGGWRSGWSGSPSSGMARAGSRAGSTPRRAALPSGRCTRWSRFPVAPAPWPGVGRPGRSGPGARTGISVKARESGELPGSQSVSFSGQSPRGFLPAGAGGITLSRRVPSGSRRFFGLFVRSSLIAEMREEGRNRENRRTLRIQKRTSRCALFTRAATT